MLVVIIYIIVIDLGKITNYKILKAQLDLADRSKEKQKPNTGGKWRSARKGSKEQSVIDMPQKETRDESSTNSNILGGQHWTKLHGKKIFILF